MISLRALLIVFTCLMVSEAFASGSTIGNGGDEIQFKFEKARARVLKQLQELRDCSLSTSTSDEIKSWILNNKLELESDIEKSPHRWTADTRESCAWTQNLKQSPISFSYHACKQTESEEGIEALLIHESVHHFGISDESFANKVAIAVQESTAGAICTRKYYPEETKWSIREKLRSVFKPNSEERSAYLGYYKDTGKACTLSISFGPFLGAGRDRITLDGYIILLLQGVPGEASSGNGLSIFANVDNSPYPLSYITYLKEEQNFFEIDHLETINGQRFSADSLKVDTRNNDYTEITVVKKTNPVRPLVNTCIFPR